VTEVIDSHVHVGPPRSAPIEDYLATMDALGLRRAVLVQVIGHHDDTYLADCLRAHPGRFAAIGSVDPDDPATVDRLEDVVARTGIVGLRLPPAARSPGMDPLALWHRADDLGLVVSVRGPFEDVIDPAFAAIVAACPRIRFRFEHLGWLKLATEPPPYRRFSRFLRLADHPKTTVLWSGFYLNSTSDYPYPTSRPLLEMAFRAFGAERTMWSGDWNRPGIDDATYAREMAPMLQAVGIGDAHDRELILGGTAARLFDFDRQPG
jgi:L-fuconolactonase